MSTFHAYRTTNEPIDLLCRTILYAYTAGDVPINSTSLGQDPSTSYGTRPGFETKPQHTAVQNGQIS